MTAEQLARASAAGVPVVPTLLQVANFSSFAAQGAERFPVYSARMSAMYERRYEHARAIHEAGVPILVGTDAGSQISHDRVADEAAELVRAGIPAADVLAAATWRARAFLGAEGIADGASADVVVLPGDPREDIGVLAHPEHIVLRGVRVGR